LIYQAESFKNATFATRMIDTTQIETKMNELKEQLQGHWEQDNDEQKFEIVGNELTVFSSLKSVKTSFQLTWNVQLGNWQIKVVKPMAWLRTYIVQVTQDSFMIYDYDLKAPMRMGARSKLLNPNRIYKYTRKVTA